MKNLNIVAAALIVTGAAAFAADERYTAMLTQPVSTKTQFIVASNIWHCEGSTCVLTSHPIDAESARACHELRERIGELSAYGREGKWFDADKLAKCNAKR